MGKNQEYRQQKSGIANPVHDKGFGRGLPRRNFFIVVPDQQVGTEAHALPPNEQHDIIVSHDEQEHGNHEEVHIGEEAGKPFFTMHIAYGIDMNEEPHTGHH